MWLRSLWKPALALMYPNHCFFAVVSVRPFIRGEYFISDVPTVFSYLEASWFLAVHKGRKVIRKIINNHVGRGRKWRHQSFAPARAPVAWPGRWAIWDRVLQLIPVYTYTAMDMR